MTVYVIVKTKIRTASTCCSSAAFSSAYWFRRRASSNWAILYTKQQANQALEKWKQIHVTGARRGKTRVTKTWLVLVLHLIGRISGASFFLTNQNAERKNYLSQRVLWERQTNWQCQFRTRCNNCKVHKPALVDFYFLFLQKINVK